MDDEKYKRKLETVAKNYAQQDCDVNMLKRLAENIYISGFKRGVEKEKLAKSKTATNSHDFDQWWSSYITSHISEEDADEKVSNKVADFKPGDKFILELGEERKMFHEFEIAGTDYLYVKTDLLEKLKRYEPENELDSAQPEPPRAYWIRGKYSWDDYHYNDTSYKCSRCGKVDANIPRYCPGCGAKMEEEIR